MPERTQQACLACRRRKIRCEGRDPSRTEASCSRCRRLFLSCIWSESRTSKPSRSLYTRTSSKEDEQCPPSLQVALNDRTERQQLLRTYFGTIHYFGFLSYIHEPTLFRLVERNQHPKDLVAVMIACTLRIVGNGSLDAIDRADTLFASVRTTIQAQMYEAYGAMELMTVILMRQYEQMKGNYSSAWMLWGNAVKMMQFLSLHNYDEVYPHPPSIPLNRLLSPEVLRRLAWSVFYLDCMSDAGRHGVHTVTQDGFRIQLPCDETSFVRGIEVQTEPLHTVDVPCLSPSAETGGGSSISAHIIKASAVRRRILHYKSRIKYLTATPQEMLHTLLEMEVELKSLVQLPPDLLYTEDNLYIHPEWRTAFILLHALRHNCFIMLAETRLVVSGRDPALHVLGYRWMRDRVNHAMPVAEIVADALRLGVVCDPFVGCLAYTAIEVLLFDGQRLAHTDPSIDPRSPKIIGAIKRLLEIIRVLGVVDNGLSHMRIEACRRIIRRGLGEDVLTQADWEACQTDVNASGMDDSEFDFRVFRWHRLEHTGRVPHVRHPWAPEAILDLEAKPPSNNTSRRESPRPDKLDASAVSSRGDMRHTAGGDEGVADLGESFSFEGLVSPPTLGGSSSVDFLPAGSWLSGGESLDASRQFDDDFARFLDQAGYATGSGADMSSWLPEENLR